MGQKKKKVAITRIVEQDTHRAVSEALALLGGVGRFVPRGSRVLIKPNFLVAPFEGGITHPEAVEAVVRAVREAGAERIYIAEGAADCYTSQCFRLLGIYEIGARWGAEVVDLNVLEGTRIPVPADLGREYVVVPKLVRECDVVVSLPVLKLWGTPMSLSLKNLFGLFPARYYGHNKSSRSLRASRRHYVTEGEVGREKPIHEPGLKETVAAINLAVPTHLTIIDGIEGFDGGRNAVRMDLIIAGRNSLATDAVGLAVGGFEPEAQEVFNFARERGLGTNRLGEIEVLGEKIEDVRFDLSRLKGNVLELPLKECLRRLSCQELEQVQRTLSCFGFLPGERMLQGERLQRALLGLMSQGDYFPRALDAVGQPARELLEVILEEGGTSGDLLAIEKSFSARRGGDGYIFFPAMRDLVRFGLAYVVGGMNRTYAVVPEGLPACYRS